MATSKVIRRVLPFGPEKMFQTLDPFIFCVYHEDDYPAGNGKYGPKGRVPSGARQYSNPDVSWKMYHGDDVPGFPHHPHAGFETITIVTQGVVDHADSLGSSGRYANGDVQWMTAGSGVNHAEMFPLLRTEAPNPMRLFQIWLRLPAARMAVPPAYTMLWNEDIPLIEKQNEAGKTTKIKVIAGSLGSATPPPPPPDSWASNGGDVRIFLIEMEANGSTFKIPPAAKPDLARSTIWLYNSDAPDKISINGESLHKSSGAEISIPPEGCLLENSGDRTAKVLLLEGNTINEEFEHHGPFVSTSSEGIRKVIQQYRKTEFGGWPWDESGPVFGDRSRFSSANGKTEERPLTL